MPDSRAHKSVAQRLDIDHPFRTGGMFRRRRWFTLACGLLPLMIVGVFVTKGDRTVYWSRPVSQAHAQIQNDCAECHRAAWQPLARLVHLNNNLHSVRDEDCGRCHDQRSDDHSKLAVSGQVPNCADCHQEHRGRADLSRVVDAFCETCHADLQTIPPGESSFVTTLKSFDDHPEFAVKRVVHATASTQDNVPGPAHRVHEVAELIPTDESDQLVWRDKTTLSFNHRQHLKALLVPYRKELGGDSPERVQLTCHDCHQPDDSGQYMRPIVFEQHCQQCHPLRFSDKVAGEQSLPHEQTPLVHGVLRDRLMQYARRHPDQIRESAPSNSRLPNRNLVAATARDEWDWVERQLREFELRWLDPNSKIGCQQCHEVRDLAAGGDLANGYEVIPPKIPSRWLSHSDFRHDRHDQLECTQCHGRDERSKSLNASSNGMMLESSTVRDILMPSLDVCRECHDNRGTRTNGRAGAHCVQCHSYHHATANARGLPLAAVKEP